MSGVVSSECERSNQTKRFYTFYNMSCYTDGGWIPAGSRRYSPGKLHTGRKKISLVPNDRQRHLGDAEGHVLILEQGDNADGAHAVISYGVLFS